MTNEVQPDMLILARESRGMTQSDLARAVSISQGTLSKYESGLIQVADEHLERIASVLDYPKTLFFRPEKRYGFGSSCIYHRKRKTLPTKQLTWLLAKMNISRIRIATLLKSVDVVCENTFQHLDIEDFAGDAEHIAQLVRASWKLPPGPVHNLVDAIESAGGIVMYYPFGTRKSDAISQWLPGLPPLFFVNSDSPGDRVRLTLAHEIGHVVMHQYSTENSPTQEQQADRFAAEFLMPASDISSDLDPVNLAHLTQLKPFWRVSIAALTMRAYDLEMITQRQYRYLFEQISKQGYRITEPIPLPHEKPTVYNDLVKVHLDDLGYSEAELMQILDVNRREFLEEYLPEDRKPQVVEVPKLRIVGGRQANSREYSA